MPLSGLDQGWTPAKERHLLAAAELAGEPPAGEATFEWTVSDIAMDDLARLVGISRGMLYKLWPNRYDFWADLVRFRIGLELVPGPPRAAEFLLGDETRWAEGLARMREPLNGLYGTLVGDAWPALHASLLAYPADSEIIGLIGVAVENAIVTSTYVIDDVHARLRRRVVEPMTSTDLAVASYGMLTGLATAGQLAAGAGGIPDVIDGTGASWTLYAHTAVEVTRWLTQPAPSARRPVPRPEQPSVVEPGQTEQHRTVLRAAARSFNAVVRHPHVGAPAPRRRAGPLGHVTLARVGRRVGVSRQAIRRHWPDRHALETDLLRYLWRIHHEEAAGLVRRALRRGFVEHPATPWLYALDHLIRHHATAAASPMPHLAFATHFGTEPAWREIARVETHAAIAACAHDLDTILAHVGRRPRAGITSEHLAALLVLVPPAIGRLRRTNPDLVRPSPADPHGRLMVAVVLDRILQRQLVTS